MKTAKYFTESCLQSPMQNEMWSKKKPESGHKKKQHTTPHALHYVTFALARICFFKCGVSVLFAAK